MRGLFLSLPPFAPDYSGIGAVFLELGAMIVIHDGTGCIGNYLCHDEPRGERPGNMVFTTNLREMEVVMGDDEALLEKVTRAAADLDPRMIVLVNTPAPIVIGTDLRALARILEKRTGKPVLYFDSNGIRMYDWGVEKALLAAVERFAAEDAVACAPGGVAVLGATPLDLGGADNGEALRASVERSSGKHCAVIGMGGGERSLGTAAAAELNLVVSAAAVPAARWCEKTFGVPWIADFPAGISGERRLGECIRQRLSGSRTTQMAETGPGPRALVIHEQVTANAVRACLQEEFGFGQVEVATFFQFREELAQPGDQRLCEELELEEKANTGRYDVILADRFLHDVMRHSGAKLVDLPHLAVCEVMFYPDGFSLAGEAFTAYLKDQLGQ